MANVVSEEELQLIAYPTIKLPLSSQGIFKELEAALTQLQVSLFPRRNTTPFPAEATISASISRFIRKIQLSFSNS